jgi:hypothetical protein
VGILERFGDLLDPHPGQLERARVSHLELRLQRRNMHPAGRDQRSRSRDQERRWSHIRSDPAYVGITVQVQNASSLDRTSVTPGGSTGARAGYASTVPVTLADGAYLRNGGS